VAEATSAHITIRHGGLVVADTRRAIRTLETSHPPTYYIPQADIRQGALRPAAGSSLCEWKGQAVYWDIVLGDVTIPSVGWSYPKPSPAFAAIRDHIAFYAAPFDLCTVDGETVIPQPGGF